MFTSLHPQRRKLMTAAALVAAFAVIGLLYFSANAIFKEVNVYYYTSSTIVQGFIALVAFLGSFVVFKIQLGENEMQLHSEHAAELLATYRGGIVRTYTPKEMMGACSEILLDKNNLTSREFFEKTFNKMKRLEDNGNAIRKMMNEFALISILNVTIALVSILFSPVLAQAWQVGGVVLTGNVILSVISLYIAWLIVQRALGLTQELVIMQKAV